MDFKLNDHIDNYIKDADDADKKVARHLKNIIPKTNHLDENTFKEIIEKLKEKMDNGEEFKNAFLKICEEYILTGNVIEADLPSLLTRVIVNARLFIVYLSRRLGMEVKDIEKKILSKGVEDFLHLAGHLDLAPPGNNAVFATFDEDDLGNDPFSGYNLKDIIHMLGIYRSAFDADEPLSAVKIKYWNKDNFEKKFPVFLDAGWYDNFFPSAKNDDYGRTRSLDPLLKNMPEIVHRNLEISEVAEHIEFMED